MTICPAGRQSPIQLWRIKYLPAQILPQQGCNLSHEVWQSERYSCMYAYCGNKELQLYFIFWWIFISYTTVRVRILLVRCPSLRSALSCETANSSKNLKRIYKSLNQCLSEIFLMQCLLFYKKTRFASFQTTEKGERARSILLRSMSEKKRTVFFFIKKVAFIVYEQSSRLMMLFACLLSQAFRARGQGFLFQNNI